MMLMLMMIMMIHDDHRNDDDPYCKLGLGQPANGAHRTSHWGPATYQPDFAANIFAQNLLPQTFFRQHANQILQETFSLQNFSGNISTRKETDFAGNIFTAT